MGLYTGCSVKVIDENHQMCGWVGIVTSPGMWAKKIYKPIPEGKFRIEFDSGEGKFYGDYSGAQLKLLKEPNWKRPMPFKRS